MDVLNDLGSFAVHMCLLGVLIFYLNAGMLKLSNVYACGSGELVQIVSELIKVV